MTNELDAIRREIEAVDFQILKNLEIRSGLVRVAAAWKRLNGVDLVDPAREHALVEKILSVGNWTLPRAELRRVYFSFIDLCKAEAHRAPGGARAAEGALGEAAEEGFDQGAAATEREALDEGA